MLQQTTTPSRVNRRRSAHAGTNSCIRVKPSTRIGEALIRTLEQIYENPKDDEGCCFPRIKTSGKSLYFNQWPSIWKRLTRGTVKGKWREGVSRAASHPCEFTLVDASVHVTMVCIRTPLRYPEGGTLVINAVRLCEGTRCALAYALSSSAFSYFLTIRISFWRPWYNRQRYSYIFARRCIVVYRFTVAFTKPHISRASFGRGGNIIWLSPTRKWGLVIDCPLCPLLSAYSCKIPSKGRNVKLQTNLQTSRVSRNAPITSSQRRFQYVLFKDLAIHFG